MLERTCRAVVLASSILAACDQPREAVAPPKSADHQGAPVRFEDLQGKWTLVEVANRKVVAADDWLEKPAIAHLSFETGQEGMLIRGYAGCNAFGAPFHINGSALVVKHVLTTQRGCSQALQDQERAVHGILDVREPGLAARISGDRLVLTNPDGRGIIAQRN